MMAAGNEATSSCDIRDAAASLPARMGDRHAFIHERLLLLVARCDSAGITMGKRELAELLGVGYRSIDRAMTRLRRAGNVESVGRFDSNGGQLSNTYRLTKQGADAARVLEDRVEHHIPRGF